MLLVASLLIWQGGTHLGRAATGDTPSTPPPGNVTVGVFGQTEAFDPANPNSGLFEFDDPTDMAISESGLVTTTGLYREDNAHGNAVLGPDGKIVGRATAYGAARAVAILDNGVAWNVYGNPAPYNAAGIPEIFTGSALVDRHEAVGFVGQNCIYADTLAGKPMPAKLRAPSSNFWYPNGQLDYKDVSGLAIRGHLLAVAVDNSAFPITKPRAGWTDPIPDRSDAADALCLYDVHPDSANPNARRSGIVGVGVFPAPHLGKLALAADLSSVWAIRMKYVTGDRGARQRLPDEVVRIAITGPKSGQVITEIREPDWYPAAIAVDPRDGDLVVADDGPDHQIKRFDAAGKLVGTFGARGGVFAQTGAQFGLLQPGVFNKLAGIGVDAHGNLYVLNEGLGWPQVPIVESYAPAPNGTWNTAAWRWIYQSTGRFDNVAVDPSDTNHAYSTQASYRLDWPAGNAGPNWRLERYFVEPNDGKSAASKLLDPRGNSADVATDRVVAIGGHKYLMTGFATNPAFLRIATEADGKVHLVLASAFHIQYGARNPNRYYADFNENGAIDAAKPKEITALSDAAGRRTLPDYATRTYWVADDGSLWVAHVSGVQRFALRGVNATGSPLWDFDHPKLVAYPSGPNGEIPKNLIGDRVRAIEYDSTADALYLMAQFGNIPGDFPLCPALTYDFRLMKIDHPLTDPKVAWSVPVGRYTLGGTRETYCVNHRRPAEGGLPRPTNDSGTDLNPGATFLIAGRYVFLERMFYSAIDVLSTADGHTVGNLRTPYGGGVIDDPNQIGAVRLPDGRYYVTGNCVLYNHLDTYIWKPDAEEDTAHRK